MTSQKKQSSEATIREIRRLPFGNPERTSTPGPNPKISERPTPTPAHQRAPIWAIQTSKASRSCFKRRPPEMAPAVTRPGASRDIGLAFDP